MPVASTPQGASTRARIVAAAAELIARRGIAGTTMDDVRAATATSKSQLYHYFEDKNGLVTAVIASQAEDVLRQQRLIEEPIDSLEALHRWRYRVLATHRRHGFSRPCPLGRLAAELATEPGPGEAPRRTSGNASDGAAPRSARIELALAFDRWRDQLAAGLSLMVYRGTLSSDADPDSLATGLLAAVQGGLLLASAARDPGPLQRALDLAVQQVTALATDPGGPRPAARP